MNDFFWFIVGICIASALLGCTSNEKPSITVQSDACLNLCIRGVQKFKQGDYSPMECVCK